MDATKIGTFIAAERRAKGWTQRQLADKLQLTDKAVSRWETGKGLPDVSFLLPLAAALDVSVGELLAGESQPQPPAVQAAETRTAEQLASYTRELGPQLRRRISPRWRGAGAAVWLAVLGGSVIEVTQLFVRTDTAPFRFDVDAILLRVLGAVVFWRIGRIPAVKKLLAHLF
ncbi:helix-turn-helix transcriptional regulator [uncultured Gemmiger sp.]|uniref:helix-turn-helix domain-containing protein n=1 Tax=uncultured Gemmiger sp. TaxID=1623490 RepID=UPI0025F4F117|nr:helix-turn-helix transcriptional regulator [uncultured Gemmiger sp.]